MAKSHVFYFFLHTWWVRTNDPVVWYMCCLLSEKNIHAKRWRSVSPHPPLVTFRLQQANRSVVWTALICYRMEAYASYPRVGLVWDHMLLARLSPANWSWTIWRRSTAINPGGSDVLFQSLSKAWPKSHTRAAAIRWRCFHIVTSRVSDGRSRRWWGHFWFSHPHQVVSDLVPCSPIDSLHERQIAEGTEAITSDSINCDHILVCSW